MRGRASLHPLIKTTNSNHGKTWCCDHMFFNRLVSSGFWEVLAGRMCFTWFLVVSSCLRVLSGGVPHCLFWRVFSGELFSHPPWVWACHPLAFSALWPGTLRHSTPWVCTGHPKAVGRGLRTG